ncbi:chitinase [Andreprevotia lacus DSM 23236]|jgi:chitinase|uniref:chitinase n=1 Tax=Andreprevotia lacus DSM 23236 TaxID=1121001 RepID=A0A1W1XY73_9NEIS|nr:glycoside hydrolase family 18 protein [Andreprevotia lacus]SMC28814.1 chitinase [Andreprevotia lacus DSM 23236]
MSKKKMLLAYIAGWQHWEGLPLERDAERLTHICYAFANIRDGEVVLLTQDDQHQARDESGLAKLVALRERHPHLKLLISIGGWTADGFSEAALTEGARERFSQSAVDFMQRYQLDGIDMDWEYPSNDMAGIVARPEDKQNFTLMLASLRRHLDTLSDTQGRKGDERYLLSIAAGAGQYYLDGVEMDKVTAQLDFVNLMTYDYYNGWATRAGHHSNLYNTPVDPDGDSCARSVALFLANGVPREKLVLGVAFYGRSLAGTTGLGEPGEKGSNGAHSYTEIAETLLPAGAVRHWDDAAKAPWLLHEGRFISYEDAESIAAKTAFIREHDLAGGFFWEYTEDRTDTLLTALWQGLQH